MASLPACALLLLSLPFLAAAQSPAPAPSPAALPDPVEILTKAGRFSILLDLLSKTGLVDALRTQVGSSEGISLFAPSDDAFRKISSILETLSDENKTTILTYHALTQYLSLRDLERIRNSVDTFADGLTLNFTGGNVVTGVVTTKVGTPLYDRFPLGIFPVEDVLIPPTFAVAPAAAPPTKALGPSAPGPAKSTGANAPLPDSAASLETVGLGAVAVAALACMSFF